MEKTNYSLVKISAGLIFTMFMMLCVLSCDKIDNPIRYGGGSKNPTVQQAVATVINVTGANPSDVTAALDAIVTNEAVAAAAAKGEPIKVTVAGSGVSTGATDQTITIPQANGGNIEISFATAPTTSTTNPLEFTASSGAAAASGSATNKLAIEMPTTTGLVITIELPKSTVTLTTDGSGTVTYNTVTAKTAKNTLVVDDGVTIEELVLEGGSVVVKNGGKVVTMCLKTKGNDCGIQVGSYWASYGFSPESGAEGGDLKKQGGGFYMPTNVKVEKGEGNYVFVGTNGPDDECLEKLTIGSGLTTAIGGVRAKTIISEGTSANTKLNCRGYIDSYKPGYNDPAEVEINYFNSWFDKNTKSVSNLAIIPVLDTQNGDEEYSTENAEENPCLTIKYWLEDAAAATFTFENCEFTAKTRFIMDPMCIVKYYMAWKEGENEPVRSQDKNWVIYEAGVPDTEVGIGEGGGYWTEWGPGTGGTNKTCTLVFKNCTIGGNPISKTNVTFRRFGLYESEPEKNNTYYVRIVDNNDKTYKAVYTPWGEATKVADAPTTFGIIDLVDPD